MGEVLSDVAALHLLVFVAISVVAAAVQGAFGFGFAIVSVPILVLLDERLAPVPQIIAALPLTLAIWWREREGAELRAVALMTVARIPGTYIGFLMLTWISPRALDLIIGGMVLLAVVALSGGTVIRRTTLSETLAGLLSGLAAYLSAIGGPPIALLYKDAKGRVARASLSLVFLIGTLVTFFGRALGGQVTELDLWLGAMTVPSVAVGVWLSRFVKDRIEGVPMRRGILALSSIAALVLFARALGFIEPASPPAAATELSGEVEEAHEAERIRRAARRARGVPSARVPAIGAMTRVRSVHEAGALPSLAGRVIDASTGEGLPGTLLLFAGEQERQVVRSGEGGAFSVRFSEPQMVELVSATATGYVPLGEGELGLRFEARPGWRLEEVEIPLRPEPRIIGEVVDAEGEPVAGARVRVLGSRGPPAHTDEGGRFSTVALIDSVIEAEHERGRGRARVDFAAQLVGRVRIVLASEPPALGAIEGTVLTAEGGLLVGAPVDLRTEDPPGSQRARQRPALRTRTDDDGRFRFERLLAGEYTVETAVEGWGAAERGGLEPGETVELVLAAEARIVGCVVDSGGSAVPAAVVAVERVDGARARLVSVRAILDPEGRYDIGGLAPGAHRVHALGPGFAPSPARDLTLDVGENRLEPIVLAGGGVLEGRVSDAATGEPLAGAQVFVEGGGAGVFLERSAVTDGEGLYRLEGVGPDVHAIDAQADGYHVRVLAGLRPRPGQVTRVDVALTPVEPGEEPRVELVGIGAILGAVEEGLRIADVAPGGGAAEAGLLPGDIILAIDGEPVDRHDFGANVDRIRGPEGSTVVLRILREGAQLEVRVPRRRIRT